MLALQHGRGLFQAVSCVRPASTTGAPFSLEHLRHLPADPATRAGDDGHLAFEVTASIPLISRPGHMVAVARRPHSAGAASGSYCGPTCRTESRDGLGAARDQASVSMAPSSCICPPAIRIGPLAMLSSACCAAESADWAWAHVQAELLDRGRVGEGEAELKHVDAVFLAFVTRRPQVEESRLNAFTPAMKMASPGEPMKLPVESHQG